MKIVLLVLGYIIIGSITTGINMGDTDAFDDWMSTAIVLGMLWPLTLIVCIVVVLAILPYKLGRLIWKYMIDPILMKIL